MASLFNELRTAREQLGVAPDASDGALLLVARAKTGDPARLAELLRDKGLAIAQSSVEALAALVRSRTGEEEQDASLPPAAAPQAGTRPAAAAPAAPAADGPMSFIRRVDPAGGTTQADATPTAAEDAAGSGRLILGANGVGDRARRAGRRGLTAAATALANAAAGAATDQADDDRRPAPAADADADRPAATGTPVVDEPVDASDEERDPLTEDLPYTGDDEVDQVEEVEEPLPDPGLWSDDVDVFASRENRLTFSRAAGDVVDLSWPAAEEDGRALVYVVVAAAAGVPVRPSAGTRLAVTTEPRVQVPAGAGPWFSVFSYSAAERTGLPMASPVLQAAGRVVPEVTQLHVSTHADAVVLSWVAPPGVDRVRVLRGAADEPLPPGFNAGLEVPANPEFARDTDVSPGRRYVYRVLTQFVDSATGQQTLSTGLDASTEIPATPEPVTALTAVVTGETNLARVELRWPTPALGKVVIYQSATVPEHAATGRVISLAQLAPLPIGELVGEPTLSDGPTSVVPSIPFSVAAGPRRAYTPVTVIGDQAAVGQAAVVNLLGGVAELELTERVDQQLLRFAWPTGANFVQVERGPVGAGPDGSPPVRIAREEYDRDGGLLLQLPASGCELHVQGAVLYATEWTFGPSSRITYEGRRVLRYRFEKVGLLGRRRNLQVMVDRAWGDDVRMALTTNPDRMPLGVYDSPLDPVALTLPGSSAVPGQWVSVQELPAAGEGFTRLFAHHPSGVVPIVIDPPMRPRPAGAAPAPLAPGQVRCVRCMHVQPELPQVFRCVGRCAPQHDPVRTAFLGEPVSSRPLFSPAGPPMHSAACPTCSVPTSDTVCKRCHALLPPNATSTDPVTLTVIGARGTGKTTYLLALIAWLENVWGPATGATAVPLDDQTEGRLRQLHERLDQGRTAISTQAAAGNADALSPLLFRLDQRNGRVRTLAIYDVAGEDMEKPQTVRSYASVLESTDAVLFLLDPLQIRSVRNLLEGQVPLPAVAGDPLAVMNNVIDEVRRRTGGNGRLPVTALVALSKLDGIHRAVRTPGTDLSGLLNGGSALMYDPTPPAALELSGADRARTHEEARSLLVRLGATQLLSTVQDSFEHVEYFGVSALGHAPAGGDTLSAAGISSFRVADPLRWLVDNRWPGR